MEIIVRDIAIHWYAYEYEGENSIEARNLKFRESNYVVSLQERVWILQEAVLARDLTFISGWRPFTFDVLSKVSDSYVLHAAETDCCKWIRTGRNNGSVELRILRGKRSL